MTFGGAACSQLVMIDVQFGLTACGARLSVALAIINYAMRFAIVYWQ